MKKIIFTTGLMIFLLGAMSAESENLIVPLTLIAIGVILIKKGGGFGL